MYKKAYNNIAIIVAAGIGQRFDSPLPKPYHLYKEKTILQHSIECLSQSGMFDAILVIINSEHLSFYKNTTKDIKNLLPPVFGGKERQDSVWLGLEFIHNHYEPQYIYIHDAARIWVDEDILHRLREGLQKADGCIPVLDMVDTLKKVDNHHQIIQTPDRLLYKRAQTPQAFCWPAIYNAHKEQKGKKLTDDAAVAEASGLKVITIQGNEKNKKITYISDIEYDSEVCYEKASDTKNAKGFLEMETYIGTGYDVHAFTKGDHLWLGGIRIPFHKGLKGHSDADVALHAITDALFGAMADGDIGSHFPPSDAQWKDASSDQFLSYAVDRLLKRKGKINNIDLTIIGEYPKITPFRDQIRMQIAHITKVDIRRISVKATTSEKLGFTGRMEGLAAQAAISIQLPTDETQRE